MTLANIKSKRTWEVVQPLTNYTFSYGATNCYDVYNETGSQEMYMYPGENATVVLQKYDASEDAWELTPTGLGSISASSAGGEYAGNALSWTSLSHLGGNPSTKCYGGSTTTIVVPVIFAKSIAGSKIRIIAGDNAGYEGTIVSNDIGGSTGYANSVVTISPATATINRFCEVEIFAGSVFFIYLQSATTRVPMQVFDIASNTWFSKASTNTNEYVQYSIKLTSLPQINSEIDTATVTSTKLNLAPSGSKLTVGGWNARAGTEIFFDASIGAPYPPSTWNGEASNKIVYTSGDGFVWTTGYRLKPSTTYTYSIYIRSDVTTPVTLYVYAGGSISYSQSVTPSASWTRYQFSFTTENFTPSQYNEIGFFVQSTIHVFGLQVEEGSTAGDYLNSTYNSRGGHYNFIRYSTAGWSQYGGCTITTGQTDPFGGTNAALCTDANTFSFGRIEFDSTIPNSTLYIYDKQVTMSCWLKAGTSTTCSLAVKHISTPFQENNSGTLTLTNEWKRYSFSSTLSGNPTGSIATYLYIGTSAGLNEGTVYAAFPQLEYGDTANEYIPTSGGVVGLTIDRTGTPVQQITLTGKNYLPGSLRNYRARYTVPSYHNLMTHSEDFTNNTSWTTTGGASKTGTVLNTPVDYARCDVRPQVMNGHLPAGTYTFSIVAKGSGTFSMYAYNGVSLTSYPKQQFTLSSTYQKFSLQYTFPDPFGFPVFGRTAGDTTTGIDVLSGQLVYGTDANTPYIPTTSVPAFYGGTKYMPIIDNEENTLLLEATIDNIPPPGTVITIEPNGDEMYLSGNTKKAMYLYNQRKNTWLYSEVMPGTQRTGTPGWEHSACFINKIDGWSLPQSVPLRQPSTTYTYGDKIRHSGKYNLYDYNKPTVFECTTPGTTSASLLSGYQYVITMAGTQTDNTAVFTQRFIEQPGRYIYSFRAASSGMLDIFDIVTSNWYLSDISVTFKYGGCATGFTTGTTYAQDKNYIYITIPSSYSVTRLYRFDVKKHCLDPWVNFKSMGGINAQVQSGQRSWVSRFTVANQNISYVYFAGIRSSLVHRAREI